MSLLFVYGTLGCVCVVELKLLYNKYCFVEYTLIILVQNIFNIKWLLAFETQVGA